MEALNPPRKRTRTEEDMGGERAEACVPTEGGETSQGHAVLTMSRCITSLRRYIHQIGLERSTLT